MEHFNKLQIGLIISILLTISKLGYNQSLSLSIGRPLIKQFGKNVYQGGTQNWQIDQGINGHLYIANNEGLLMYDGYNWNLFALPNRTVVWSIALGKQNEVYVGGQNELGFFSPDTRGCMHYTSYVERLPESHRQFDDVWRVVHTEAGTYYQTYEAIFLFTGDTTLIWEDLGQIDFLGKVRDQVIVHTQEAGSFQIEGTTWTQLTYMDPLRESNIVSIKTLGKDSILFATANNGIWLQAGHEQAIAPFPTAIPYHDIQINALVPFGHQDLIVGTVERGVYILNYQGQIKDHFTKANGLQDDNVLALFQDQQSNLWIGLNTGIDLMVLGAPFRYITADQQRDGTAYASHLFKDHLYLGTSNGLYRSSALSTSQPGEISFRLVPETKGQIWNIQQIDNQLFVGHHHALYYFLEEELKQIPQANGFWTILPHPHDPDYLIGGTYNGLVLLKRTGMQIDFSHRISGFDESSRFLVADKEGGLWVSHPYKGVFRLTLSSDYRQVEVEALGPEKGLPSILHNHVFWIHDELLVGTQDGVFVYDFTQRQFLPHTRYNTLIGPGKEVSRLIETPSEDIWVIANDEVGILSIQDIGLERKVHCRWFPWLTDQLVGGFEHINQLDSHSVMLGLEKGFLHVQLEEEGTHNQGIQTIISGVYGTDKKDTLLLGPYFAQHSQDHPLVVSFPIDSNSFRFTFAASNFSPDKTTSFRYKLVGLEEEWSTSSTQHSKEYTNLPQGSYTFYVKAIIDGEQEVPAQAISIDIRPPWYASRMMMGVYGIGGLLGLLGLILVPQIRFRKEREAMESERAHEATKFQATMAASEKQISDLETQKLENEIQFKNQELAMATMHLVQKNGMLNQIKDSLKQLETEVVSEPVRLGIRKLITQIGFDEQLDRDWEQFAFHFDRVHAGFLRRLQKTYPQLSPKDRRLCAYLRLNLTSKEIAPLLNISVRGVEISRYRLRKKLSLPHDQNLNEFMTSF